MVPAARQALDQAQHIVGYETYVHMAGPFREDQQVHASDNRVELDRSRHALELAAGGATVAVVSSGDPGIFAMAAAVLEVLDTGADPQLAAVRVEVIPGITAAQATASRIGAPLGHDFCVMSLSDNLKPWDIIAKRLRLAAEADFVIALYNPISKARPHQLGQAFDILRTVRGPDTPVVLGRDVDREGESLTVTTLAAVRPEQVDMRTCVLVGSSRTRLLPRSDGSTMVYTPRFYPSGESA